MVRVFLVPSPPPSPLSYPTPPPSPGDDSASPESAPGNTDDDDYIYPDTDGGGDDDDDDDMHVAVGQAAGPIQGRAAEEVLVFSSTREHAAMYTTCREA